MAMSQEELDLLQTVSEHFNVQVPGVDQVIPFDVMTMNKEGQCLRISENCDKLFFAPGNKVFNEEDRSLLFLIHICDKDLTNIKKGEENPEAMTMDQQFLKIMKNTLKEEFPDTIDTTQFIELIEQYEFEDNLIFCPCRIAKADENLDSLALDNLKISLDTSKMSALDEALESKFKVEDQAEIVDNSAVE